jgi:hypothetical protein
MTGNHSDRPSTVAKKLERSNRDNAEAAAIIAGDPGRYGPALAEWARLWMSRHERVHEGNDTRAA